MIEYVLPIGYTLNEKRVEKIMGYETTGEAEKYFVKKPTETRIYTWMSEVISAATHSIGGQKIASEFFSTKVVPTSLKKMPLSDADGLILQIHRECWEDILQDQKIQCEECGQTFKADVELFKIETPKTDEKITEIVVTLSKSYTLKTEGVAPLKDMEGMQFNTMTFRVPLLQDALKHEKVAKDSLVFWRRIAGDTLQKLSYVNKKSPSKSYDIDERYKNSRTSLLFSKEIGTKDTNKIRASLRSDLPSTPLFYKDTCTNCGEETPYYWSARNFFLS